MHKRKHYGEYRFKKYIFLLKKSCVNGGVNSILEIK